MTFIADPCVHCVFAVWLYLVQSLSHWNVENEHCLSDLLEELLVEYRVHHRNKLASVERLSSELTKLSECNQYSGVNVHCNFSSYFDKVSGCLISVLFVTLRNLPCNNAFVCGVCMCVRAYPSIQW